MIRFRLPTPVLTAGLSLGLVGASGFIATPAQAICLTGGLNTSGNTCDTFNNTGTTTATLLFTDPGLNSDQYLQIGFGSTNLGSTATNPSLPSGFSVTNIEYSIDNINFSPFGPGSASQAISNNNGSTFTALYTPSFQLPSPLPGSGTTLYVRYTLPSTITTNGQVIGVYLRSNINGATNASPTQDSANTNLLSSSSGDGGGVTTRSNTLDLTTPPPASDVPGPVPLMGGAAAFGFSRRLRRRIERKA